MTSLDFLQSRDYNFFINDDWKKIDDEYMIRTTPEWIYLYMVMFELLILLIDVWQTEEE